MARQKSTIRFNPLAAVPSDAATRDYVVPPDPPPPEAPVPQDPLPVPDAPPPEPTPPADDPPSDIPPQATRRAAMRIVRRYMAFSAAAGALPLPAVDVAGAAAVQVAMLHAIATLYGVPFNAALARQLVTALICGGGAIALAMPAASAAKTVPVVGGVASVLLSPAFATLSCYGTGRTFVTHFEAGGTLETFDPAKSAPGAPAA